MGSSAAVKIIGVALLAALLIVAIGLSLRPPARTGDEPRDRSRDSGAAADPERAPALIPLPEAALVPEEEEATAGERPAPEPDAPKVEGLAVLEDGRPLPGVAFVGEDGPLATSGLDGSFRLPLPAPALTVSHPEATPVQVEGGGIDAEGRLTVTGTRLRIVFRDRPGRAHVRLVNAATGVPVSDLAGLRIRWTYETEDDTTVEGHMRFDRDSGAGGWISLPENDTPIMAFPLPLPGAEVLIRFTMPGFATARVPIADLRGRNDVRVEPVPPDARAVIRIPAALRGAELRAAVRSRDPEGPEVPDHLYDVPVRDGKLLLYDLPDGRWAVEISAELDGQTVRAGVEFERAGGTAEIGEIHLTTWAGIRARVTDLDGKVPSQARVVIVREGEDPTDGRRLEPDEEGYVCLRDFEPGVTHVVSALGLPEPLVREVRAPDEPGKVVTVELRWPDRLVPCRIRFTRDGADIAVRRILVEAPLSRERWRWAEDGAFLADLLPGDYEFETVEGGALVSRARLSVVPAPNLEETLVLEPKDD